MNRILLTILIAISVLITVGAASAMDVQIDKYTLENPDYNPDCSKYNVQITYSDNVMTVTLIEPTFEEQPAAHLKDIGLNLDANTVLNVTLLDDTEMKFGTSSPSYGAPLGTFNTEVAFDFKTVTNQNINPKPRAYKIIFANDIVFESNSQDFLAAVHVGGLDTSYTADGSDSVKLGNGECGGGGILEVPEFPTVALPIAAIIGLAFFFQRRRE
ncbi:PEF-CTERM sorting domain-containing protein [uncultured Methanolobus sp.]|uniref:PEF-CTERM sorting domain-containing protein n=1 Tax=uncultured Methanolobus sp. TaxID=218300 RepID=UPI0029C79AC0|nr:PEF-CTERM sorting domain-containing protein [uncultured Methanolobus sp.]